MLTDDEIAAIKARTEEATRGPWKWQPFDSIIAPTVGLHVVRGNGTGVVGDEDAVFIAYAREDIPALLAEVERLREREAALETLVRVVAETQATWWGTIDLSAQHPALFSTTENLGDVREQARALLGEGNQ